MSRTGKKPIPVPKGVDVTVKDGLVEVKGPKGELAQAFPAAIRFRVGGGAAARDHRRDPPDAAVHGLARTLVANAVTGVSEGFKRELDIVGVGYRAEVKGRDVHFALGYSHPVIFRCRRPSTWSSTSRTHLVVSGIDKQLVGQWRPTCVRCASPTRTSRRACATPAKC